NFGEPAEQPPQQAPEEQNRRERSFMVRQALAILLQQGRTEHRGGAQQRSAQASAVEDRQHLIQRVALAPENDAARYLQQRTERTRQAPALAASDPHQGGALDRPGGRAPAAGQRQRDSERQE